MTLEHVKLHNNEYKPLKYFKVVDLEYIIFLNCYLMKKSTQK